MSVKSNNTQEVQGVSGGGDSLSVEGKPAVLKSASLTIVDKIKKVKEELSSGDTQFIKNYIEFREKDKEENVLRQQLCSLKTKLKKTRLHYFESDIKKTKIQYKEVKKSRDILFDKVRKWPGKKNDLEEKIEILEMQDSIQKSTKEFAVVAKENKKRVSKMILSKISKLPEVIVDYIQGFIPIEILNELISQKYRPLQKLIPKLDRTSLAVLIKRIYLEPKFVATCSPEKVIQNTYSPTERAYKPEWRFDTKANMNVRFLNAVVEIKRSHPELLYKLFSTLAILIQPDKTYKGVYNAIDLILY
jgi:hypothetical protein